MKKHLDDYLLSPLTLVIAGFLLALILLIVLLFTSLGIKIIATAVDSSVKELSIRGISGSLLSGLHINEIIWEDGDSISLKNVDLKIQKFNLKKGRLVAESVKAERLGINLINTPSNGNDITSLPNFGLPLNMNAHIVQLDSLRITQDIPDDPGARTLLFQIKDIQLKKVTVSDNLIRFRRLQGNPIIIDEPLKIDVTEGRLNMNQPHDIKTSGDIAYQHPELGNVEGHVNLAGTLTNYSFEGAVTHQHKKLGKQTIKLHGQGDYKRVHLEEVDLNSPHGKIKAKGRIIWKPELRWAFLVNAKDIKTDKILPNWPSKSDAEVRVSGSYIDKRLEHIFNIVSLEGKLQNYQLIMSGQIKEREGIINTHKLNVKIGDNELQLSGQANEPFDLKWQIDASDIQQVLPKAYQELAIGGKIKGQGQLKGRINRPEISIDVTASDLSYKNLLKSKQVIKINGDILIKKDKAIVNNLSIKSGQNSIQLTGQASEPLDLKMAVDTQYLAHLSPILAGQIKGTSEIKGSFKEPNIHINLNTKNLRYQGFSQGNNPLNLTGNILIKNNMLLLKELKAYTKNNTIDLSGKLSEPLDLSLNINAKDLSQASSDLAGSITGSMTIAGDYDATTIKTKLIASNLAYQDTALTQGNLTIDGEAQLDNGIPIIKRLITTAGNNRIAITGRATSPYQLKWNINGNNLTQFLPALSGQLFAKGTLNGTSNHPILNTTIKANGIHYKDSFLASANLDATTNNGLYRIKGKATDLKLSGQTIKTVNISVDGSIKNHTIRLNAIHDEANIDLNATGKWEQKTWTGLLRQLIVSSTQAGDWHLAAPTPLALSQNKLSTGQLCMRSRKASACSTTRWTRSSGLVAKGTLNGAPLALLKPWLPEGLSLNGSIKGRYDLTQNNGHPKGVVNFMLPDSNFSYKDAEGEERILAYKKATIDATIDNRTIRSKGSLHIVNRGDISSQATLQLSPENGRHTIDGTANFFSPNINWAQRYIPHSRGLIGIFNSKISFSGLLAKPQIKGSADLKKGYLRLPEAGTELNNIRVKLRAKKPGKATINGKISMGKGVLNLTGNLNIDALSQWKAMLKLKGNNIHFMNTNEIKATMTPDITLNLTPKKVNISGNILIPSASINLKKIPDTSIDESSDAIIKQVNQAKNTNASFDILPNVQVKLGDNVKLNAFGLKADVSGTVDVLHNKKDILANGSLRVTNGKYKAYGQDLDINNGRLIFKGSPKFIGMDIRATRKVENTLVGVHLGGTLLKPKSTIFSDPTLPESEALSFLISGHSLSTSSGQESALLMSAARGLGISGSNSLIHKIGASFGLDDVNIVTKEDFKKSELSLGKQLGSKLYIRYLVGLFDQTQKLAIEYKINKILSLEAQSSSKNYGLDFIYEIERD